MREPRIVFCLSILKEAVFKGYAVVHIDSTDDTGIILAVQIPAVVGVAVCYAAIEHVAIAYGKFCGEAVGIFAVGLVVVVVVRRAVLYQVIVRPCVDIAV